MSAQALSQEMRRGAMVTLRLDELLTDRKKSAYWLAQQTGLTNANLSRLRRGLTKGIDFETIDKLCSALECEPGELFTRTVAKKGRAK
jgi:putative transcriptional regulator